MPEPEVAGGQEPSSQAIQFQLDRMKYMQGLITFYVECYLKKIEAEQRRRLQLLNEKIPLKEECLARVLKKEFVERGAMRVLDKDKEEMATVMTVFQKAINDHKLDKDDEKFFGCMRGNGQVWIWCK